ncbi:UDP-glucose:undecaprenyl-phosphate glucose-1-phosphate transferase [Methylococcus capsulatus]|jgi:putative colanic acid biosynthesis UDP-glucose lipid carrier transferase|uniref:UDP-glucose:undecaprenyl-phosphate glucose-1-phosphate transferase n=1 Tax=Methylococcus capsulatus TaxID=414 RepID=A0AA35XY09_METCP|nr:undecaprenyl-phosphate glucose phosphotransferase [Methylococcus capsulatus]CAI8782649.1 UDP-glucose:undecaprenyl-phosphate glucose-1-phosphate transferase [Methylococcus capsulatus]
MGMTHVSAPSVFESPLVFLLKTLFAPVVASGVFLASLRFEGYPLEGANILMFFLVFIVVSHTFKVTRLNDRLTARSFFETAFDTMARWIFTLAVVALLTYVAGIEDFLDEPGFVVWAGATPFILLFGQLAVGPMVRIYFRRYGGHRKAVIVGVTEMGVKLAEAIGSHAFLRTDVLGFFEDRPADRTADPGDLPVLGRTADLPAFLRQHEVHAVYITLPIARQPRILELLDNLKDSTVSVYFVPDLFMTDLLQARWDTLAGIPVMAVCESPFIGIRGLSKRLMDIVGATVALVLLAPVMLVIALAVRLSSPGPVLFKQRRYGEDGEPIFVYKFRSMTVCEDGGTVTQAKQGDARVTPLGAILRRTSLDELPQFLNVLQGTMSLVGPRPHAVAHNELYRGLIKGYMVRHKVKPGITGWAQVNGLRGETETVEKMAARIRYDLEYLRNWSLWLDMWILLKTVGVVLKQKNAY